jgi:hypothetical protein
MVSSPSGETSSVPTTVIGRAVRRLIDSASIELQELKKALAKSPSDPIMPKAKTSKKSIQPDDPLSKTVPLSTEEPSKVAHMGNNLDPK